MLPSGRSASSATVGRLALLSPVSASQTAEDARLNAFLDAAFDEQVSTNPQFLTQLGSKELYDRLNNFTDAYAQQQMALELRHPAVGHRGVERIDVEVVDHDDHDVGARVGRRRVRGVGAGQQGEGYERGFCGPLPHAARR